MKKMKIQKANNNETQVKSRGWIRVILLCISGWVLSHQTSAQFVLEPFASKDNLILESWYYNSIDEARRLSIFNLNEANYNYETGGTSFLSYGVVGFNWKKGFGPITGWRLTAASSAALAGLQYGIYGEDFFVFFYLNSELKKDPNFEFYSISQYRRKINDKLKAYGQLQFSNNFKDNAHYYSFYRLRLGVDLGKIQTGFGLEQTLIGEDWDYDIAPGLFVRLELY